MSVLLDRLTSVYPPLALLLSALLMLSLGGCTDAKIDSSISGKAPAGVIYCSESNPSYFNPQLDTSSTTADVSAHQIYSRLLEFDPNTGRIQPGLASSWLVSDDGLTYTFQLRRNVKFHNTNYFTPTRNFNADDVIFSFQRWLDDAHPYHDVNNATYPYFSSLNLSKTIASIDRINGYRIEIKLFERDSSFLANLATDFAVILSQQYGEYLLVNQQPENIDFYPIGTGPFRFDEYRKNQFIRLLPHLEYWKDVDLADQLIYDITPSSSIRFAKLRTGECDSIAYPSQAEITIMQADPNIVVQEAPGLNVGFWAFNTAKAPFDRADVRRGLALAIDKNSILDAVYFNSASRARSLIPPSSWAYNTDIKEINYNPMRARELLDKAGIPKGFRMTIWAMPVVRAYNPDAERMAQLIKSYLAAVDIDATIVTYDWNTFRDKLSQGEHDSVLIGWSADNGDPDNFYRPLLSCDAIPSGTNRAMWCNPEFDALVNSAIKISDEDKRAILYAKANNMIAQEMPLLPIAHANRYQVKNAALQGLTINPYGSIRFEGVIKTLPEVQRP
ncbi:MAG: ABC transporter substrate-binding protein [Glaciecola sp.]|jgi:cationic peptide transport system substrate-binding protein|nr:ABC transporter substrate-binding protein [Glaciecola sp.]MDG1816952.1 ABC transporter substrate-binding protein [Glaciecola sp.]MDG2099699.1 ABC transporter substrate-binding protein [Glaciecola sp.]